MSLHYSVTEDDYLNFQVFHSRTSKVQNKNIRLALGVWIATAIIVAASIIWGPSLPNDIRGIRVITLVFNMAIIIVLLFRKPLVAAQAKAHARATLRHGKYNDFIGQQIIILTEEDYFENNNKYISSKVKYMAVDKFCYGYGNLVIYTGSTKAIIVPIVAFEDKEQRADFINAIEQKTGIKLINMKKNRKGISQEYNNKLNKDGIDE